MRTRYVRTKVRIRYGTAMYLVNSRMTPVCLPQIVLVIDTRDVAVALSGWGSPRHISQYSRH